MLRGQDLEGTVTNSQLAHQGPEVLDSRLESYSSSLKRTAVPAQESGDLEGS